MNRMKTSITIKGALMFLGHFAVGFAAKRVVPKVSLGTLFLAVQLQDLIWPVLLLTGVEHVRISPGNTATTPLDFYDYPITHSLLGAVLLAAALGILYWLIRKSTGPAIVISFAAFSHWILDFITHRPDLPLTYGGEMKVGLGLWNSFGISIALEILIFSVGVFLYLKSTRPRNRTGTYAMTALIVLLLMIYSPAIFGPPPPSTGAIALAGNAMWLLVVFGYWVDRNRIPVPSPKE